ncbi:hypothetical protein V9L05_15785 [Bernardetia sp. Wsw4-3y2]|uniref:hypothetical protein n=1 Tax=unclassified Bernardetia TaxID=2647129 RepID=UPI0030CA698B
MKNYFIYIISFWLFLLVGITLLVSYKFIRKDEAATYYANQRQISKSFLLTDFCFSTESRHVRHLSMPEWIAPFQDFPAYHEHFPSSSFFKPLITE